MRHKIYIIFAKESIDKMNGIRGKMCTQAGHAALHAFWDAITPYSGPWWDQNNIVEADAENIERLEIMKSKIDQAHDYANSDRAYKITLIVDTVDELRAIQEKYKNICGTHLVTDAAFTVFTEPTTTCLGLGPISEDNIGDDIKALKTFT